MQGTLNRSGVRSRKQDASVTMPSASVMMQYTSVVTHYGGNGTKLTIKYTIYTSIQSE